MFLVISLEIDKLDKFTTPVAISALGAPESTHCGPIPLHPPELSEILDKLPNL